MQHNSFLRKIPVHDNSGHESIYKNLFSHHGRSFMSQGPCHLNLLQLMQTSAHDSNEMTTDGTPYFEMGAIADASKQSDIL